jgi:hypothetical protein
MVRAQHARELLDALFLANKDDYLLEFLLCRLLKEAK